MFYRVCQLVIFSQIFAFSLFSNSPKLLMPDENGIFNVKEYGAKGDGKALDSKAINEAIDAASAIGGGQVYIPAGNYLCGSIHLKSNIALYIEQGATIIATSENPETAYDKEEQSANTTYQDSGHSHWHNSLIWGEGLHDVSILGPGKIWGRGLLKDWKKNAREGNKAIALLKCFNVIIRDVSILHGGWFAILATGVDNLTINNVKLDTNRDGMDIDCCKNVKVSDCFVNSPYDDGICLKSTYALGYNRNTENVTITNCQVSGYDEGSLLDGTYKRTTNPEYKNHPTGRIKLGTESNGGFKNITISNCVFDYCRGLALETVDGAELEDITINNITMRDVVNDPIFLRLGSRMRAPVGTLVGELRRVMISNIIVYNADAKYTCTLTGLPQHPIKDIWLKNIKIYYGGGVDSAPANDVIVPEAENKYPEPGMFGTQPCYGLYIRHAENISISDFEVMYLKPDKRAPYRFDDVKGIELFNVKGQKDGHAPAIILNNVSSFSSHYSFGINEKIYDKAINELL